MAADNEPEVGPAMWGGLRLARFQPRVPDVIPEPNRLRDLIAVALILAGLATLVVGAGLAFGWPYALIVGGLAGTVTGVLLGFGDR